MRQLKKITKWISQTFFVIKSGAKCRTCESDLYIDADLNFYCLNCDLEEKSITDVKEVRMVDLDEA